MSFGITKTIPQTESQANVDKLYDGSLSEFEFHKAGGPARLSVGDYVYTIYKHQLIGRLKITRFVVLTLGFTILCRLSRRAFGESHPKEGASGDAVL